MSGDAYPAAGASALAGFLPWLAAARKAVLDLRTSAHFDDVLATATSKVRLRLCPEELVFVGAKTTSPAGEAWLHP